LTFSHLRYGPAMTPDYTPSLLRSFERHLQAENRSDNTIESYLESIRQAEAFLAGRSRTLLDARRADLEAFLGDLLQRRAPATAATRYKVLRILYTWLEEEEEITVSPMAKMRPPIVPEQPIPIVPEDGLRRLQAACAGKHFEAAGTPRSSCSCSIPAPAGPSFAGLGPTSRSAAAPGCGSGRPGHWNTA
jgi:hypothetical protein